MPDKPQAPPDRATAPFSPDGYRIVALHGRDAAIFAHAQFMSDVAALAPGHWHWSGWLTPKGRVIALFALLRIDAETLWLLLPDADPAALVQALQRFVFRSKLVLAVREDLAVQAGFATPARASGARMGGDADDGVELDYGGDGGPRTLRIGPANAATTTDTGLAARWRACDLQYGLPRLEAAQAEQWTPQQLSLDRLRAYSVKKGCYPGQEIVARTHFLGQAKRGLVLLEANAALPAGAEVRGGEAVLGTTVATADANGRHLALAVLALEREAREYAVGGVAAREAPLQPGLAR